MKNETMEQVMKAREHDISHINEEVVVYSDTAIEKGVVKGYKKIENGVVDSIVFQKENNVIPSATR